MSLSLADIRKFLTDALSDEEVNNLCFDHFHEVYDTFAAQTSKTEKIRQLVDHCDKHGLIPQLLTLVRDAHPKPYERRFGKLALPPEPAEEHRPEEWYLAHPYPMPPHFTGRAAERAMLSAWLNADPQHPLLVLRALGGFGKSALAWHWLLHDVPPKDWPRVVWYCFYETESSFDRFLADTLDYLRGAGLANLPQPAGLVPRQQVDALLAALRQPGTLLILDGFERALRAYGGMDAPYRGDAPLAPSVVGGGVGGEGEEQAQVGSWQSAVGRQAEEPGCEGAEERRGRDCLSPLADLFLRGVATLPWLRGKVLLTTRLRPCAVEIHSGELLQGCCEEELKQMHPADAVAFFRALGIRGGRAEIEAACAPYGYHPLSLRLLAGLIVADPQQPGDIAAARRLNIAGDLVARQHHVLQVAYDSLPPARQALLSRIACFRGPVTLETLGALDKRRRLQPRGFIATLLALLRRTRTPSPDASVPRQESPLRSATGVLREGPGGEVDSSLRDLISRALLHHDTHKNRFDLHPIVRRYAYDRLTAPDRSAAHATLRDYFAAVPTPERVQTLDDLAPVIELYHHTVRAGQYDQAFTLFRDRLHNALYYQFGAYQLQIDLLRALFPDGEDRPPRLQDERAQAWTLAALANSYSLSGHPRRAVPLFEQHNTIYEKRGDKTNLAIGLGNLACMAQIYIGALRAAEANLRRRIALCREIEDGFGEAVGHAELGRLLSYRGLWTEAEEELAQAQSLFEKEKRVQGVGVTWAYRAQRELLLLRLSPSPQPSPSRGQSALSPLSRSFHGRGAGGEVPLAAARRALELALGGDPNIGGAVVERDVVRSHWLLVAAHRVAGHRDDAERHLHDALQRCRRINLVELEADILIDLARLRADSGAPDEAQRLLVEALTITERSGYVLQGADAHLVLAQLALAHKDHAAARHHAQSARDLATCDGPPDYTYRVAYDEARALLLRLMSNE